MLVRFFLLIPFLITFSVVTYSQEYESIEKAALNYFIDLSAKNYNTGDDLSNLRNLLFKKYNFAEFESKYKITENEFDSLKKRFDEFESINKNISEDSALVLFNGWYLHLSNLFYHYSDKKFFSSDKVKILLFSTSMSCHCTLEMCKNQTIDLLKFAKKNSLDYWIIDSYEHNELQIKFETYFAPSVIIFDAGNNILLKLEYDENMITKINQLLLNKLKG